jgi:hypothetical protein
MVAEKSPLPAVIITPSSPSSSSDFAIAFLPTPTKPSFRQVLGTYTAPLQRRARTTIILIVLMFVLLCHLITHRLATRRPHLDFSPHENADINSRPSILEWLSLKDLLGVVVDEKREFVITEMSVA